jgi:hypothetical protein
MQISNVSVTGAPDSAYAAPAPVAALVETAALTLGTPPAPKPKLNIVDDRTVTTRTSAGKMLTVKRLSVVEKMRLARALGEHSGNDSYGNFAVVAASVREIDSMPIPFPMTTLQLEATVQRLDDDGMEAAIQALIAVSTPAQPDAIKN